MSPRLSEHFIRRSRRRKELTCMLHHATPLMLLTIMLPPCYHANSMRTNHFVLMYRSPSAFSVNDTFVSARHLKW